MFKLIGIGIKADASIARKIVDGIAIIGIASLIVVGMVTAINHIKRDVVNNEIKTYAIEQPRIRSGNQALITCEDGIVHVDNGLDGYVWGETVKVKWASPIIGGTDMVKTLYCLNGSIRAE